MEKEILSTISTERGRDEGKEKYLLEKQGTKLQLKKYLGNLLLFSDELAEKELPDDVLPSIEAIAEKVDQMNLTEEELREVFLSNEAYILNAAEDDPDRIIGLMQSVQYIANAVSDNASEVVQNKDVVNELVAKAVENFDVSDTYVELYKYFGVDESQIEEFDQKLANNIKQGKVDQVLSVNVTMMRDSEYANFAKSHQSAVQRIGVLAESNDHVALIITSTLREESSADRYIIMWASHAAKNPFGARDILYYQNTLLRAYAGKKWFQDCIYNAKKAAQIHDIVSKDTSRWHLKEKFIEKTEHISEDDFKTINSVVDSRLQHEKYASQVAEPIKVACLTALEGVREYAKEHELTSFEHIRSFSEKGDPSSKLISKIVAFAERHNIHSERELLEKIPEYLYEKIEKPLAIAEHFRLPTQGFEVEVVIKPDRNKNLVRRDFPVLKNIGVAEDHEDRVRALYEIASNPSFSSAAQTMTMGYLEEAGFIDKKFTTPESIEEVGSPNYTLHISTVFDKDIIGEEFGETEGERNTFNEYKKYAFYLCLAYASEVRMKKKKFMKHGGLVSDKTFRGKKKEIETKSRSKKEGTDERLIEIRGLDVNKKNQLKVLMRKQYLDYAFKCSKLSSPNKVEKEVADVWEEMKKQLSPEDDSNDMSRNIREVYRYVVKEKYDNQAFPENWPVEYGKLQKHVDKVISRYAHRIRRMLNREWDKVSSPPKKSS